MSLGGCASYEQLLLPESVKSANGTAQGAAARKPGVDLANAPAPDTTEPRVFKGTGTFTGQPEPRPLATTGRVRDGVSINLSQASIGAAAKAVLGDTLGLNHNVSDKVKGSITLQTPSPVERGTLLEMFEAALEAHGAGIVEASGMYSIVPIEEARASPGSLRRPGATARVGAGRGTEIVPLQYVAAGEMERILKSVAPQGRVARADQSRNLLVLTGTRTEIQSLKDAIAIFDVDWMKGMSFAIYPVESSDPDAIVQELDQIFANDQDGSPAKGIVRFIANRRLKSVLVISSRPDYLAKSEKWIQKLDMVGRSSEKQVHVYHVQNRPATELAGLLQRVYATQERARSTTSGTASEGTSTTLTAPAAQPAGSAIAPVAPPAAVQPVVPGVAAPMAATPVGGTGVAAGAAGVAATANAASPPTSAPAATDAQGRPITTGSPGDDRAAGISVVADEANNALVITASAEEFKRLKQILLRVDIAPSQVILEATIAEVTLNDQLKFGLKWFFERGQSKFTFTDAAAGAVASAFPGFSYFLNSPNVKVSLDALSSITDVNVVSAPTLMVLDNKKAVLQIGDEVPVATQSAVGVLAPGAPIVNSITFRNTGIILGITPRVSDRGRVLLDIEQEVSDVVPTTSSTLDSPTIQQRRVRTTVAVADGESLLLAGLIQDRANRERTQVPLLGGIPIVGNLFKTKNDTIKRTELLIAITPRIVKDDHKIADIVHEFRDKMNFRTRPQRNGPPDRKEQVDRLVR